MLAKVTIAALTVVSLLSSVVGNDIYAPKQDTSLRLTVSSADFVPEGIAYDKITKRILLSEFGQSSTTIRAIPYSNSANPASFTNDNQLEFIFTSSEYAASVGIAISPDGRDAWVALDESFPPTVISKCAVARINLRNTSDFNIVEFSHLRRSSSACFTNDITFSNDGQYLFVTDFYGYQVFYMDISDLTSLTPALLTDDLSVTCNSDGGACPATVETFTFNGPNGIEVMPSDSVTTSDDILLFTNGHNRLTRALMNTVPSSYAFTNVNIVGAESVGGLDGMVANPISVSNLVYSVVGASAYTFHSADAWLNARLVSITEMNCPNNKNYVTTAALVEDEIAPICNNDFGAAPYDVIAFPLMTEAAVPSSTYTLSHDLGIGSWSMEYDLRHDRMVVGSTDNKGVIGFPSFGDANEINGITYESLIHTYFEPTGADDYCQQILFLVKDGECNLWATCTSYQLDAANLPERIPGSQGVGLIDMCDTSGSTTLKKYIDLTDLLNASSVLVKHVIYVTNGRTDIFVSDLMAGHVFRVTDVYATNPTTSIEIDGSTGGIVYTNGLEVYNDILLIGGTIDDGSWTGGLFRYYISTKEGPTYIAGPGLTPGSPLINSEGIRFNGDKSILYWPKYLSNYSDPNEVLAVQSNDGWVSDVRIAMTLQIDCVSSSPRDMSAAVAFSDTNPDNAFDEDLWVVCNNNNGNGPYEYPRVQNVNGLVTGLSRTEMAVNSDTLVSSSDDSCEDEESVIYGLTAVTVLFVFTTIVFAFLWIRGKQDEMRKTLNDKQDSNM